MFNAWVSGVLIVELMGLLLIFNRVITMRQAMKEARSGLLVQLERRNTILQEVVPLVKASKDYEASVFAKITELRAHSKQAGGFPLAANDEGALRGLLGTVFAAEANPKLKSAANFHMLMSELTQAEDDIQGARLLVNQATQRYNRLVSEFPSLLLARTLGYRAEPFFETPVLEDVGRVAATRK